MRVFIIPAGFSIQTELHGRVFCIIFFWREEHNLKVRVCVIFLLLRTMQY